ncbi:alpha/beta hydrolase [Neobacillus sp. PS3-34]|uniref:alpha/beta fold hydrolase n=1 Tax=Neobacillus sp. PS3-34 TaxID=3070678 RepID=UPI0027DF809E|nr:alpha/beta hydrolase [Neobacillus sp. PS3-34]WML48041.1 alpha/beta hydrolase [Neobacillus sp. PS3-34]
MKKKTIYKSELGKQRIADRYRTYLINMDSQFEEVNVKTRFGKTHVLITGPADGKPLFIFQGGNCISPMTLSWFEPLLCEYRIYASDTIGHPGFSDETRLSGKDNSYALWIADLMDYFNLEKSAFIGPSFGGGMILRLAAFLPERISCAILVSPAGIAIGSKATLIKEILLPLTLYKMTGSERHLKKIADRMSANSMKKIDEEIIGDIFNYIKFDEMPKLTDAEELVNFQAPTLVIAGTNDVFFPSDKIIPTAKKIIPNLISAKIFSSAIFLLKRSKMR